MASTLAKNTNIIGNVLFLLLFCYTICYSSGFPKLPTLQLIVFEVAVLLFCEFGPVSLFLARKTCHAVSGVMMLHLDMGDPLARYFVYCVAVSSLMMVWQIGTTYNFRFSSTRDVGITVYLLIVSTFFFTQTPLEIINPVFLADPLGALVGKSLTKSGVPNPRWCGSKTMGGSFAVFLASLLTLSFGSWSFRAALSLVIALVEGVTLKFDNLFITGTVLVGYIMQLSFL